MRQKSGNILKADVVVAARDLFLAHGVEATSMDDVARAIGVSKPKIYEHFPSKQLLLEAVFEAASMDVEIEWMVKARDSKMRFDLFLLETARQITAFLNEPRRLEAYQLVLREGPRSPTIRAAFTHLVGRPTVLTQRDIIVGAIERGECKPLDPVVVQRMISAPLYYAMTEMAVFGDAAMSRDAVALYFHHSYQALIDSLCLR